MLHYSPIHEQVSWCDCTSHPHVPVIWDPLVYICMTWMVWSSKVTPSGECLYISHALYGAYAEFRLSQVLEQLLFDTPYLPNPCEYLHNPYIARNYIHWTTFPLLTAWLYLHLFSSRSLPNTQNHAKFRENSTSQQFKVIQDHRSWCQWKAHVWLPISH